MKISIIAEKDDSLISYNDCEEADFVENTDMQNYMSCMEVDAIAKKVEDNNIQNYMSCKNYHQNISTTCSNISRGIYLFLKGKSNVLVNPKVVGNIVNNSCNNLISLGYGISILCVKGELKLTIESVINKNNRVITEISKYEISTNISDDSLISYNGDEESNFKKIKPIYSRNMLESLRSYLNECQTYIIKPKVKVKK